MKAKAGAFVAIALFAFAGFGLRADIQPTGAIPGPGGSPGSQSDEQMRRFALVVGSNGGGGGRVRLKYAGSDARSFASVMTELGGVSPSDLTLLLDPDVPTLERALKGLADSAARALRSDTRSEIIFYYSGHSDEEGLLLGSQRFGYPELRSDLENAKVDLRVAILDSCASGAMTRAKGGRPRPAFVFDESSDMRGHAYITSSMAAESAQESDRLGGSFFTHYLVSGLRGAADTLGQGRVTLNEAYAYAFRETLASTEDTEYGPQHAAYEINLTGSGDLVLTDLRSADSGLVFAEDLQGRVFVRDAKGTLAVELSKARGKRIKIGLQAGTYGIILDEGGKRYAAEIRIPKGGLPLLSASDLRALPVSETVARGLPLLPGLQAVGMEGPTFSFQLLPDLKRSFFSSREDRSFAVNALVGSTRELRGMEVAGLLNTDSQDATGFQAAGLANAVLGSSVGFQTAGLVNYVGGDMEWAHIAGLANLSGGRIEGMQIAGLVNLSGGGRVLYAGNESLGFVGELPAVVDRANFGFQTAGLGNLTFGSFNGFQVGGAVNWSTMDTTGVQIAGLLNRSRDFTGLQLAVANIAQAQRGLQLGVFNDSRSHVGAQIGLVNVSGELSGVQLGLVNVAERITGPSFGLVSVERNGIALVEGTTDLKGRSVASLKVGTRFSYTMVSVGTRYWEGPGDWNASLGLGGRLSVGPYFIDADAAWRIYSGDRGPVPSFEPGEQRAVMRALFGSRIDGPLALVAGLSAEFRLDNPDWSSIGGALDSLAWTPDFVIGLQL